MGERTGIEWCRHTFNPWWGCQRVSPGCNKCYAEALDARFGGEHWGPKAQYRTFGEKYWKQPWLWNDAAKHDGVRRRVFCASMADVFDIHAPSAERERLWAVIDDCRALDWLLLTKRPQNFPELLPWTGTPWPHVWLGVSAEDQPRADQRIPILLGTPAAVRFVSYEPALGPIDFAAFLEPGTRGYPSPRAYRRPALDWIIAGSESGHGARPMDEAWVRAVRDQCAAAEVSFFYKQRIEGGRKVSLPILDGHRHAEFPQ